MSRRKGRVLAFQTLYSYEVGGIPLEDLLSFSWASESGVPAEDANKEEYAFARLLAAGMVEHLSEINKNIKKHDIKHRKLAYWWQDRCNRRIINFHSIFQSNYSVS